MSKLLLASVAAIGLLLAGPQKASAQVVHACVSSAANSPIIIEPTADAACPPSAGGVTWTKTTLSTTPGLPAGLALQCAVPQTIQPGGGMLFIPSLSGVSFGSAIEAPGTPPFAGFLLQPGIYSINLSVFFDPTAPPPNEIDANLNGTNTMAIWYPFGNIFVGERLISVSQTNTILSLIVASPGAVGLAQDSALIITQVH